MSPIGVGYKGRILVFFDVKLTMCNVGEYSIFVFFVSTVAS
jgi:hypothetical protein